MTYMPMIHLAQATGHGLGERLACGRASLNRSSRTAFVTCPHCQETPAFARQVETEREARRARQRSVSSLPPHLRTEVPSFK